MTVKNKKNTKYILFKTCFVINLRIIKVEKAANVTQNET